jgi:hypothetical protein
MLGSKRRIISQTLFSKTIFIKGLFGSLGEEDFELKEG